MSVQPVYGRVCLKRIEPEVGEAIKIKGKLYTRCPKCNTIVRVNKPLIGDLHVCD